MIRYVSIWDVISKFDKWNHADIQLILRLMSIESYYISTYPHIDKWVNILKSKRYPIDIKEYKPSSISIILLVYEMMILTSKIKYNIMKSITPSKITIYYLSGNNDTYIYDSRGIDNIHDIVAKGNKIDIYDVLSFGSIYGGDGVFTYKDMISHIKNVTGEDKESYNKAISAFDKMMLPSSPFRTIAINEAPIYLYLFLINSVMKIKALMVWNSIMGINI